MAPESKGQVVTVEDLIVGPHSIKFNTEIEKQIEAANEDAFSSVSSKMDEKVAAALRQCASFLAFRSWVRTQARCWAFVHLRVRLESQAWLNEKGPTSLS